MALVSSVGHQWKNIWNRLAMTLAPSSIFISSSPPPPLPPNNLTSWYNGIQSSGGRCNFSTQVPWVTFTSRLLSLLKSGGGGGGGGGDRVAGGDGGGGGGGLEGVGGVRRKMIAVARSNLLHSLDDSEHTSSSSSLSPEKAASMVCEHYNEVRGDVEQRLALISVLASDLAIDHTYIENSANQLSLLSQEGRSEVTLLRSESYLRQALTPFYSELFVEISRLDGGIQFLVNLRADILEQTKTMGDPQSAYLLTEMESHLRDLLGHWFSPSLLDIGQLTWESPCDIMEKVSEYEAVHRLRHWKDLKHRVGRHRRCFVFTHRSLPREPLVILHIALTSQPSSNIKGLLDRSGGNDEVDLSNVNTAVFYSISSTQRGLSGIDLGYFVIRRVVDELQREFPGQLATFVTLSPVPGFRKWLEARLRQTAGPLLMVDEEKDEEEEAEEGRVEGEGGGGLLRLFPEAGSLNQALQMALATRDWMVGEDGEVSNSLRSPLLSLCARYLVKEKRRTQALDPVAHFHLNGGARVYRLNWLADVSPLGLQNSYGVMCNYHYNLSQLTANSERYRATGDIAVSDSIQNLLQNLD